MKNKKKILIAALIVIIIAQSFLLIMPRLYLIKPSFRISEKQMEVLNKLLEEPKKKGELNSIAAIVIYKDSIVGKGYNNSVTDSCITGHAEINALNDFYRKIGPVAFRKINKDSLTVISTLEPCLMCKGVMEGNKIKHIYFLKSHEFSSWLSNAKKIINYDFGLRKVKY